MKVGLRLDYATMNFVNGSMSLDEASRLLAGSSDYFCWTKKGLSYNAPQYSPLGVRYQHNNGYEAMPHKLEVSGVGCQKFMLTLPRLRSEEMRFSRLDFAFDIIMDRTAWKVFLGNCFISSMESERQAKRYRLSGDGEAMTVYIGSRCSPKFFRIYNKTLQDRKYQYRDGEGKIVDLREDQCVVRYEIELHRHKVLSRIEGERLFDPSPCFDWYYSAAPADHERLHDEIRRMWLSFGNDVLLPADFENIEFVDLTEQQENKNFVQCSSDDQKLEIVQAVLHDYPHSFDRTLRYVTEHYGKYIPYILADDEFREFCFRMCRERFGFAPDYIFEQSAPAGYYDMDDLQEADEDIPFEWVEAEQEDQVLIDPSFERRCNQWS